MGRVRAWLVVLVVTGLVGSLCSVAPAGAGVGTVMWGVALWCGCAISWDIWVYVNGRLFDRKISYTNQHPHGRIPYLAKGKRVHIVAKVVARCYWFYTCTGTNVSNNYFALGPRHAGSN